MITVKRNTRLARQSELQDSDEDLSNGYSKYSTQRNRVMRMRNHPRERPTPLAGYKDGVNAPTRQRQIDTPSRSQPESIASYHRFSENISEYRLGESVRLPTEKPRKTYRFDDSEYDRKLRAEELASKSEEVASQHRSSQSSSTSRSRKVEPFFLPSESSGRQPGIQLPILWTHNEEVI